MNDYPVPQAYLNRMQAWIKRRKDAHKAFTEDDVWDKIRSNWPKLGEGAQELIFQSLKL